MTCLLGGVVAVFPQEEGLLGDDVHVVQLVEEGVQQLCKERNCSVGLAFLSEPEAPVRVQGGGKCNCFLLINIISNMAELSWVKLSRFIKYVHGKE